MSELEQYLRNMLDECEVNDILCLAREENSHVIAQLERKLEEAREVQNQLGKWVHEYSHCMRTVDYCGSLEDANEMDQYLYQLKEQNDEN